MVANALATTTPGFMQPAQWQMMTQQADVLVKSGFLPSAVNTAQKAIAIMMVGQELGILPWQALSTINVIQGKPTVSPQLMLGLIQRSGQLENIIITGNAAECVVSMKRKGQDAHTEVFTIKDAEKLGLSGKDNYKKQPATMLKWRAVAACARTVFPDVVLGLYTPEEMGADVAVTETGDQVVIERSPLQVVKNEPDVEEAVVVEDAPLIDHAQGGRADGTTEVSASALTPRKQPAPAPEVVDPYANLRSQLEEAGVTTITSIKNITDTRVRVVTKEDYSVTLTGMLASVKLTAAKVGERYFEIEWSEG